MRRGGALYRRNSGSSSAGTRRHGCAFHTGGKTFHHTMHIALSALAPSIWAVLCVRWLPMQRTGGNNIFWWPNSLPTGWGVARLFRHNGRRVLFPQLRSLPFPFSQIADCRHARRLHLAQSALVVCAAQCAAVYVCAYRPMVEHWLPVVGGHAASRPLPPSARHTG